MPVLVMLMLSSVLIKFIQPDLAVMTVSESWRVSCKHSNNSQNLPTNLRFGTDPLQVISAIQRCMRMLTTPNSGGMLRI